MLDVIRGPRRRPRRRPPPRHRIERAIEADPFHAKDLAHNALRHGHEAAPANHQRGADPIFVVAAFAGRIQGPPQDPIQPGVKAALLEQRLEVMGVFGRQGESSLGVNDGQARHRQG